MNHISKIEAATQPFTRAQAEAIAAYAEARAEQVHGKPGYYERWDAYKEIQFCALSVLDALDGVEGYGYDAHAALQREMEAFGCDSIWAPLRGVAA